MTIHLDTLMERHGVSQGQLAADTGLTQSTIAKYRKGQAERLDVIVLERLAAYFQIKNTEELITIRPEEVEQVPVRVAPPAPVEEPIEIDLEAGKTGWLTTDQAAAMVGKSPATIRRWIRENRPEAAALGLVADESRRGDTRNPRPWIRFTNVQGGQE